MTRAAWTDVAQQLARVRRLLVEREHADRIIGFDVAVRTVCRTLRKRSSRFDGQRFMQLVRGD